MAPAIPSRYRLRIKQRLAVVKYALEHGVKPAGRHFGMNRKTVREWRDRWRLQGEPGLVPRYPERRRRRRLDDGLIELIRQARTEHGYGSKKTKIWLDRVHHVRITVRTIQRVFHDIGMPYLVKPRRRRPRQLKLFEKENPGDSVQVDVKVIRRSRIKWFQYTAIDDCTRIRVLRLYRWLNQKASLHFLRVLTREMPFTIRKIQVDNGTEFSLDFALTCAELGMRVRYIKPRQPQQNGKVERSHRIDAEEFWNGYVGEDFDEAVAALARWNYQYNHLRFSLALNGLTPMEKLAAVRARAAPGNMPSPAVPPRTVSTSVNGVGS